MVKKQHPMETVKIVAFLIFSLVDITLQGRAIGDRPLAISRIVGGYEALPHEFPWLIHFINGVSRTNVCGGAIIDENWVITAAHCFPSDSISRLLLVAGDHNQILQENTEQEFELKAIQIHKGYNSDNLEHDIALVQIDGNFTFNEFVRPISLPVKDTIMNGNLTVAGWGILREGWYTDPDILRKVTIPIVPINNCFHSYKEVGIIITSSMLCAGAIEGGKDACKGDSGSPAVCFDEDTGEPLLCGIVSFGFGCARPQFPGVYTRVESYIDWIYSHGEGANLKLNSVSPLISHIPTMILILSLQICLSCHHY